VRSTKGIALITALVIMVVVGILVTGALFNSMMSLSVAGNDRNAAYAQYLAQVGLSRFTTIASQSSRFVKDNWADYGLTSGQQGVMECAEGDYTLYGIDLDRLRNGNITLPDGKQSRTFDVLPGETQNFPVTLPDGTPGGYEITFAAGQITSRGWAGGNGLMTARSRSTVAARLVAAGNSGYNDAIRVQGFTGPAINGNLAVYGSVHSVKQDYTTTQVALDLGGTSGIYNDYRGQSTAGTDIRDDIETLGGDRYQNQLCSRVKLKSGQLDMSSGSSRVGMSDNKVLAVYLQEGANIIGNTSGVNTVDPLQKYTDTVGLPALAANYPNDTGFTVTNSGNCTWLFQGGKVQLPPSNRDVTSLECGDGTNTIRWIGPNEPGNTTGLPYLSINGVINTGNVDFEIVRQQGQGQNPLPVIYYQGRGTIRVGSCPRQPPNPTACTARDLQVNRDLMPLPGRQFVTDDILGFVSNGTVGIATAGGATQVKMAALFYSKGETRVRYQSTILGSIIAEKIDMGQNVPRVAWDRRLANADNLPPGMPTDPSENPWTGNPSGANPAGSLPVTAWERR
jgi:type II secretory pathway pseudopilin PulG